MNAILARPARGGRRWLILSLLGCILSIDAVRAEPPTLSEAVDAALEQNRSDALVEVRMREAESLDRRSSSWLADDPSFEMQYIGDQVDRDIGFREWEAALNLPLPLPGQRAARVAVADAASLEAGRFRAFRRWEAAGLVRAAAWAVRLAQVDEAESRRALERSAGLEEQIRRRYEAGELPNSDLLLARQQTAQLRAGLRDAEQTLETARADYRRTVGLAELPVGLEEQPVAEGTVAPDHPQLAYLAAQLGRYRADGERVRSERRENWTLSVVGRRDRSDFGADYGDSLGLALSVPFGLGSHSRYKAAEADRQTVAADVALHQARRALELDLEQSRTRLDKLSQSIESAIESNDLAQRFLAMQERAFELGEIDLLDLIRARERALAASSMLERRRAERMREIARFNQAAGVIPR
ncbi:MAG: TolC family protein [Wenzhouxiangella sp.]|jgi:outer membrane protein TolC|nr:TolC family protein [Wenzhouxiangella sp.]